MTGQEPKRLVDVGVQRGVMELGTHRAANHFWIPEINASRQRDRRGYAERGRRTQDRTYVSRILNAIEQQEAAHGRHIQCIKAASWDFAYRENSLRRFGLGSRAKVLLAHFSHLDLRFAELTPKCLPPRCVRQLRGDQGATNGEIGSQQFFDRSNAFRDEH